MPRSLSARVLAIATGLTLLASPAIAQSSAVDLVGEWDAVSLNGSGTGGEAWTEDAVTMRFTFTEQDGAIVWGSYGFTTQDVPAHDGADFVMEREIPLVGTTSMNGEDVVFASTGTLDGHVFSGYFVDEDTLELVGREAGEFGWVMQVRLERR